MLSRADRIQNPARKHGRVVQVGQHKRNLVLPRTLVGLATSGARFDGDTLRIKFSAA